MTNQVSLSPRFKSVRHNGHCLEVARRYINVGFNNLFDRLTYDIWRRLLPRYKDLAGRKAVLECGTGPGRLLGLLGEWFPEVQLYGLDIDPLALRAAREICVKGRFLVASAECLPFPDQRFDILLSLHMIEHLKEPEHFFREAARVLRPGGVLVFATPNPTGVGARMRGPRWSGFCPDHISLHPPEMWQEMLKRNGFVIMRSGTTGLSGIPVFRKFPLALLNWGPLLLFGFFPWRHGEAYVCISKKEGNPYPGYW